MVFNDLRSCLRSLRAAVSCGRMTEHRNRSLHRVNEDFECRPTANDSGKVDLEKVLSIVIPVAANDQSWKQLLPELQPFGKEIEIIMAACKTQPTDIEFPENVVWIETAQGRAPQLNAGARRASRSWVWFLHADTRLNSEVIFAVHQYLLTGGNSLGYFKLKFASDGPRQTVLNAWAANMRSRFFGLPFGDQGFILSKNLFEQFNGFDEAVSLGEDLDFVVRLQAAGISIQELPAELTTSSRRYQQYGWLMTSIRHIWSTWRLTRQAKQRLEIAL